MELRFVDYLINYSYYYPLYMAFIWMIGAVYYYFHWETGEMEPPKLSEHPLVSVLVPCHNEERHIATTIEYLTKNRYPNIEIIAVDDGSTDRTWEILESLARKIPNLRIIHFEQNQGKAMALNAAALASKGEFLVTIDADAILDEDAIFWIMHHFLTGPRVGGVTGNPRVRNRSSLLGKIQVGEFSAIIGLIKRAQRIYGRIFTVSGVIAAFRKTALHRVGYWHTNMVTEDIDVSWRLELDHWQIRFEPHALCWMLVPETLGGLWRQRLRWAQGGSEVILKYFKDIFHWQSRRMWGIYAEYILSLIWSYSVILVGIIIVVSFLRGGSMDEFAFTPSIYGTVLGTTFLLQFFISLMIDSRYEKGLSKFYYWIIWYPFFFWIVSALSTSVGFVRALVKKKTTQARWHSPDRGIGTDDV